MMFKFHTFGFMYCWIYGGEATSSIKLFDRGYRNVDHGGHSWEAITLFANSHFLYLNVIDESGLLNMVESTRIYIIRHSNISTRDYINVLLLSRERYSH